DDLQHGAAASYATLVPGGFPIAGVHFPGRDSVDVVHETHPAEEERDGCGLVGWRREYRVGRTPWSARVPQDPLPQALTNTSSRPTWASAADQGVRPTLCFRRCERGKHECSRHARSARTLACRVATHGDAWQ